MNGTPLTDNERELLSLCKTQNVTDFAIKAMTCILILGDTFTKAVQGYLDRGDVEGMIEIVNRESQAIA